MNKSTANQAPAQPRCLTCRDDGKILSPYYSDFTPRLEWVPCPNCHPVWSMKIGTPWALGFVAAAIVIVLWGTR